MNIFEEHKEQIIADHKAEQRENAWFIFVAIMLTLAVIAVIGEISGLTNQFINSFY